MMRVIKNTCSVAGLLVISLSAMAFSEDVTVNFDQGVDTKAFIQMASGKKSSGVPVVQMSAKSDDVGSCGQSIESKKRINELLKGLVRLRAGDPNINALLTGNVRVAAINNSVYIVDANTKTILSIIPQNLYSAGKLFADAKSVSKKGSVTLRSNKNAVFCQFVEQVVLELAKKWIVDHWEEVWVEVTKLVEECTEVPDNPTPEPEPEPDYGPICEDGLYGQTNCRMAP